MFELARSSFFHRRTGLELTRPDLNEELLLETLEVHAQTVAVKTRMDRRLLESLGQFEDGALTQGV